jgi:hypothetical protein
MITDRVWQQFLYFCHRNGLYYGDKPHDTTLLRWNDASMKIVRSIKNWNAMDTNQPKENGSDDTQSANADLIVVSSLERHLRK